MSRGELLSYASVAAMLDCSTDTVARLWKKGLIPPPQEYEGLGLRFCEEDIKEYVYSQRHKHRRQGFQPPPKKDKKPAQQ